MQDDKPRQGGARSASRLGAIQALYQMEMNSETAGEVIPEFLKYRLGSIIEDEQYNEADNDFFQDIVRGVEERQEEIDPLLSSALSEDWTLDRIESVIRAILRAGTYELLGRPDVPTKVIINEYVDLAKAFFEDSKPGFVNGILDRLAGKLRS
ncbi:transcription antitermination factor NusB [Emcibacter nanhaiensis]|uniref:Transcription antitermination protein NusB n=1 Tax=Emcibacter nanhaiensis TaxID=1505037 RepID=A0A501PR42_9PROT|nr:transcription antitermination factor NusB [Emcibacter nanhaiensis]TPD62715.1 transcription antitermination factor NusB [Emcibacter nanhaiensis]